ncbi:hypothetical protein [Devosia submarina]|uniref:hypothetical protein n=1 Tax=Devosia submarina TaxID=1173082 RepID=UPI0013006490|nr:hypothetical protein [Devosia submarina]
MSQSPKEPKHQQPEKQGGDEGLPPAGPHAEPDLTDMEKTPGTGSLPDDTNIEGDVGPD